MMNPDKVHFASAMLVMLNICHQLNGQTAITLGIHEQKKLPIPDSHYSYVDTFINDCLHKIDVCERGEILVFNVSVSYSSSPIVVLYSSGGDSAYTPGGVYLNQVAVRGDFYLELGISYGLQMFTTKLYLNDETTNRLALIWSKKDSNVKIYENGNLFSVDKMSSRLRTYYNLNFNPIRRIKYHSTRLNQIYFSDTDNETAVLNAIMKGARNSYFLGCYQPKESSTMTMKQQNQQLVSDSTKLYDQCKKLCFTNHQQILLINQQKCACASNKTELGKLFELVDCQLGKSWHAYIATNLRLDFMSTTKLDLKVEKVLLKELIEVGDMFGLKISSPTAYENFQVQVNFSEGDSLKTLVGNCFLFNEYSREGSKSIRVQAHSLSNPSMKYQSTIRIQVSKRIDRLPMKSVELNFSRINETSIHVNLFVVGGEPYSCALFYGDSSSTDITSSGRLTYKTLKYTYKQTGLYNVSVICTSSSSSSQVGDWTLVYLPQSSYTVKHLFAPRINSAQYVNLQLPFGFISPNINLKLVDLINSDNSLEWTAIGTQIKLVYDRIKNLPDNYFQIVTSTGLTLATYLITLEDSSPIPPVINLLNESPLSLDETVEIEIVLPWVSNGLMKVDFGDEKHSLYQIISDSNVDDRTNSYTISLSHRYDTSLNQDFNIQASLINHLGSFTSSLGIKFEANLPEFLLTISRNVSDIDQPVRFSLETEKLNSNISVKVPQITIFFDYPNNLNLNRSFSNVTFESPLIFDYQYPYHGSFNVFANCSNIVSFSLAKTYAKVGQDIEWANGRIRNYFAHINEPVNIVIRIGSGNGYSIVADFGDSNRMYLPWSYLNSNGSEFDNLMHGYVRPKATFGKDGINIVYAYKNTGNYQVIVNVSNPFGSFSITFCSKVHIQKLPNYSVFTDLDCRIETSNIKFLVNNNTVESSFNISKGFSNILTLRYLNCPPIKTYWTITKLDDDGIENEIEKYCLVSRTDNQFELLANELSFGIYSITAYAVDNSNFVVFTNKTMYVVPSSIVVGLNLGITYIDLNWNEDLILDFYEDAYDPDLDNRNDRTAMRFYFVCTGDKELSDQVNTEMKNLNLNVLNQKLNLAFYEQDWLYFFEDTCFFSKFNSTNEKNPIKLDKTTHNLKIEAHEMNINKTNGLNLDLYVAKGNRLGMSQRVVVNLNLSSTVAISKDLDVQEMSRQLDKLDEIAKTNPVKALSLLTGFVDVINAKADDIDEEIASTTTTKKSMSINHTKVNQEFSNLRGKVLNTVGTIVELIDEPLLILTAVNATASISSNIDQMPTSNQMSGSAAMEKMGEKAKSFGDDIDSNKVVDFASTMLGAGSNMLRAASITVPVVFEDKTDPQLLVPENDTEEEPIANRFKVPLSFYMDDDDSEDFPEDRFDAFIVVKKEKEEADQELRVETARITRRTFNGISGAATALAGTIDDHMTSENTSVIVENKGVCLVVSSHNVMSHFQQEFKSHHENGPLLSMPSLEAILDVEQLLEGSVQTKLIVVESNPLQSATGQNQASGKIVNFEIADKDGREIEVKNTSEPFKIVIPSQQPAKAFRASLDPISFTYFKIFLSSNQSSLHFVLQDENYTNYYHVYVKYSLNKVTTQYPDEKNYDYVFTLPNELQNTVFISDKKTIGNGTYYIGIKLAKLSSELLKILNESNSSILDLKLSAKIRIWTTSCKYWNEEANEWRTDGCEVGANTTYNATECLCTHLTTFGTDFYVPPNTIEFSTVFAKFRTLHENAAVFATVCTLLGLYAIVAVVARFVDKRDLARWRATPLVDNLPYDGHFYLISAQTGVGKDTGTTSRVGFVLSGELADSGVRKLSDGKRNVGKFDLSHH